MGEYLEPESQVREALAKTGLLAGNLVIILMISGLLGLQIVL